jgi:protein-S-isoprenylcysteine O-methyltransferase Ste14
LNLTRLFCLVWPALLVFLMAIWRRSEPRLLGASLASFLWTIPALLALQPVADRMSAWSFEPGNGALLGVPAELLLGWALLWGALPVLVFPKAPLLFPVLSATALDLMAMPLCAPVLNLGPNWLVGELVAVIFVLLPALILGRSIAAKQRLRLRVLLGAIGYAGLQYFVVPALVLEQTGANWDHALGWSREVQGFFLQAAFFLGVPGLSAVQEFFQRGAGTPLPFDPPRRLVTSGPYAYVANPMQVSTMLLFLLAGVWTGSLWVAAAGGVGLATAIGIAAWHEQTQLSERFGDAWARYRAEVRTWLPRWRPRFVFPARLYIAEHCALCASVAHWFSNHSPIQLIILPAESHPNRTLRRMRYEAPGFSADGIAAFAHAIEHLHLGWAFIGWTLRLPLVVDLSQFLVDLSGGGPRTLPDHPN